MDKTNWDANSNEGLKTAVLLLTWKRAASTSQVIEKLREVKARNVYVVSDGPRAGNIDDAYKVAATRDVICNDIDWDCSLKTVFRENNLGCRRSVSDGISWLFQHEEEAIILEDDCIPSTEFFNFCEYMLGAYRNDRRVASIGGYNEFPVGSECRSGFVLSRYFECWGWATWRRAWSVYDDDLNLIRAEGGKPRTRGLFRSTVEWLFWDDVATDLIERGVPDSWAYRFLLCTAARGMLHVIPNHCLTKNIGFDADGTHHQSSKTEYWQPKHPGGAHWIPKEYVLQKEQGLEIKRDRKVALRHGATWHGIVIRVIKRVLRKCLRRSS